MKISWLVYIMPAIGWGLMPILSKRAGGTPKQQLFGTSIIALIVTIFLGLIHQVNYQFFGLCIAMLSGFFWAIGQLLQFEALKKSSVSKVMPVSNGSQLIFTSVFSGLILSEWKDIDKALI
ncbi:EamA family transporter [Bacillaceae bacterium Marseille-Q3522]|nr:EamA family transporter [Bacillaceae bacterium Marseille-Q3522]